MSVRDGKGDGGGQDRGEESRGARLAEALRQNLRRRKAQARSRRGTLTRPGGEADVPDDVRSESAEDGPRDRGT